MSERIKPPSDLGFKKITSAPESKDVLRGSIGDFFDLWIPLEEIHVTAPYDIRSYEEYVKLLKGGEEISETLRQTVQDVVADIKIADFTAEAQIKTDGYFSRRSLYYACGVCAMKNEVIDKAIGEAKLKGELLAIARKMLNRNRPMDGLRRIPV